MLWLVVLVQVLYPRVSVVKQSLRTIFLILPRHRSHGKRPRIFSFKIIIVMQKKLLREFCYPDPKISRNTLEGLFFQLIELEAPGYKNHFTVEGNSSSEKCYYRITDKKGNYILSIYHGPIIISDAKSSWEQVICLRVSLMVKAQYRIA